MNTPVMVAKIEAVRSPLALANELLSRFGFIRGRSGDPWDMLQHALTLAAEAQQTISEQQQRISYLESLSLTDELTGLANRRHFDHALGANLALARRHGLGGVLALFDLDNLKLVNDGQGHAAGDRVLQRMAEVIRDNIRSTDLAARLGGDEFAVLLTQAQPEPALKRAAFLQQMLNRANVVLKRRGIVISASMGALAYGASDHAEALLAAADRAMYVNKHQRAGARMAAACALKVGGRRG